MFNSQFIWFHHTVLFTCWMLLVMWRSLLQTTHDDGERWAGESVSNHKGRGAWRCERRGGSAKAIGLANRISPCLSITPSPHHHAAPSLLCCQGDHNGFQLLPWWYPVGPEDLVHRDVESAHKRWSGFKTGLGSVSAHQGLISSVLLHH